MSTGTAGCTGGRCTSQAAIRGRGEREISRGSINIMEICNNSVPAPVRKFRRRPKFMPAKDLCMHAEIKGGHPLRSADGGSGRATKRNRLLQYPQYGHVSRLF